ncbi:MAG: hypothetical protein AB1757_01570 [Acidobacteriota bacterium]
MIVALKTLFSLVVAIHGLIHWMGFAKAFNFAEMSQLTQPISRFQGLIWLLAAVLFLLTIPVFLLRQNWWWLIALPAIAISQFIIICSWQDAKFGTIANVIVLVVIVLSWSVKF